MTIPLTNPDNPMPGDLSRFFGASLAPMGVAAAMELDVFTALADGPLNVAQLAAVLSVGVMKLQPLIDVLVYAGFLTAIQGRYENTLIAQRLLVRGQPAYMGGIETLWQDTWRSVSHTAASIRSGRPQAEHDFSGMNQAALRSFLRSLTPSARPVSAMVAERIDLSTVHTLLDAGGGVGALSLALTDRFPNMSATVLDLPAVAPLAKEYITEMKGEDRVAVVAGNLLQPLAYGPFDVVLLRAVLQTLNASDCGSVLTNVAAALRPGGLVIVLDAILDDDRTGPFVPLLNNLVFLNIYQGGQSYTESDHRDWLVAAGFSHIQRDTLPDSSGLITAVRT